MFLHKIALRSFRNYDRLSLTLKRGINLFIGPNGAGKTNILEGIYAAATGTSHRTVRSAEMIRWNESEARVRAAVEDPPLQYSLELVLCGDGRKSYLVNGAPVRPSEYLGLFQTVFFAPEDLSIVKGPPGRRRRFLDAELLQADAAYRRSFLAYNKILAQRNAILKKGYTLTALETLLEPWDEQLVLFGSRIVAARATAVRRLNELLPQIHESLGGEEGFRLRYETNAADLPVEDPEALKREFSARVKRSRTEEKERGQSLIGPQRDELVLFVGNKDLRVFGSQGQQRTATLALRMAQLAFIEEETGRQPILLLDDVFSELDQEHRSKLMRLLSTGYQSLITATDLSGLPEEARLTAACYAVDQGGVKAYDE